MEQKTKNKEQESKNKKRRTKTFFGSCFLFPDSRGFTLIELTFVIAIFGVMASVVLFKFRDFGTRTSLDNLSQDVALQIVGAQKAAISGAINSGISGIDEGTNAPSYGVYVTDSLAPVGSNKQINYFADNNHDKYYDPGGPIVVGGCPTPSGVSTDDLCQSVTTITTGDYISNVCYIHAITGVANCPTEGGANITFTRPFPDATMRIFGGGPSGTMNPARMTYIEIASGNDTTLRRTIIITSLGEVRVYNGCIGLAHGNPTCLFAP